MLYLFTDGKADQFGGHRDKKIGYKLFKDNLMENAEMPMLKQKENLESFLFVWMKYNNLNYKQTDDITILGFRYI